MKDLERVHAEMHATIKQIVQMKSSGKAAEAAAEFKKVEPLSAQIVTLLKEIENHVHVTQ